MSQAGEILSDNLSIAVSLIDNYTNEQPIGRVTVTLKDEPYTALKNPSGYYLFLNLPEGDHTVQVRSDFYSDNDLPATVKPLKSEDDLSVKLGQIVKVINLEPTVAYPFPNGATVIRGVVKEQATNKVFPNATVTLVEKNMVTSTTEKGEYFFYFGKLTSDDTITKNGVTYVKPTSNSTDPTMTIQAQADGNVKTVTIDGVQEGVNTSISIKF